MMQSEVSSQVNMKRPKATIKSLPLELYFMIIERLRLKDALNMAEALLIPEQVAVQYFAFDSRHLRNGRICFFDDLQPSSFKFLLKNKMFQVEATSNYKTLAAVKTKDLDFVTKYLEQVEPDLDGALIAAASSGFTDAVKLLLLDDRVDPSAQNNEALLWASQEGYLEIVKILLSDDRVDPSAEDNGALCFAAERGQLEIVKILLSDDRVDPSAEDNGALCFAAERGHLEIVKILLADDRVDPSARNNEALFDASSNGHLEIVKLLESHPRFRA
jgi:ankyrin repeat protein